MVKSLKIDSFLTVSLKK